MSDHIPCQCGHPMPRVGIMCEPQVEKQFLQIVCNLRIVTSCPKCGIIAAQNIDDRREDIVDVVRKSEN